MADNPPRCVLGEEHALARAHGSAFDDLAAATLGSVGYAFWSDAGGLYGVRLNAEGNVLGSPTRIGDRCLGGLAAASRKDTLELACLRPLETSERSGVALLFSLDSDLRLLRQRTLGVAGRVSHGIELSISEAGEPAVVWHDGTIDGAAIRLWRVGREVHEHESEPLLSSSPMSLPADPTLTWLGKRLFLSWSEASRDPTNKQRRVVLSRGKGTPVVVTTVTHEHPMPRLRTLGDELYLAFRDARDRDRKPGLYVSRVSDQGRLFGELSRLSRAAPQGDVTIVPCFGGVLAVAPRGGSGGKFVGINWVDRTLTHVPQERQFYEDSRQFALAAGACTGDHALLLIGEEGGASQPDVRLRSVSFRCH